MKDFPTNTDESGQIYDTNFFSTALSAELICNFDSNAFLYATVFIYANFTFL